MANDFFRFKQFTIRQDKCAMKVTTDACLFGAWVAATIKSNLDLKCLDIGTGTGLLSLMLAQAHNLQIDAIELDRDAAAQASENIAASPWAENISVMHGDILAYNGGPYDLIITNPPFYESDLAGPNAKRNMAHHAGGLQLQDLLGKTSSLLSTEGDLFLLLPFKRQQEVGQLLHQAGLVILQEISVYPTPTHKPIRLLLHVSRKRGAARQHSAIFIKDENGHYTSNFTALLKPYYLYL